MPHQNLESLIDKELSRTLNENQIAKIKDLINEYEQDLYDKESYTEMNQKKVKYWRQKLFQHMISKEEEEIPEILESTVNIVNRQINKIDNNMALLNKGTIKLLGLDYTNTDIDKALIHTKNKILERKSIEKKEIRFMYISLMIFVSMCIFILIDKFFFNYNLNFKKYFNKIFKF
ncbi:molecular chaperone [Vairimorpha apis BRL 01]|uniref:Molecular chaperone n=1 Tax=Vairimorpha apis BRL 01 TaxID=1037528 RepID=T0L553_9MICR|nr:molecular chaperone [Vairimorpha apis BRL 01]